MPLVINPDFMILDGGEVTAPRMKGPKTDTSQVSLADAEAASMQAGKDLGLTDAQLQESITDPSQLTKTTGESNTAFNARVTTAYKEMSPQPELTEEQIAAGATVKWVRTGAAGVGEYKIVYPIGVGYNPSTGAPTGINAFNFSGNSTVDANGNPIVTPVSTTSTTATGAPTTNIDVLKAALRGLGFTSAILDSSTSFLNSLLKEGLDYDNATEIFLNSKEYTLKNGSKISSPFYTEYGYLNEGLVVPKSANELFNTVEGMKGVVDKYKLSSKYLSQDNLKLYFKNDITVDDMAKRAAMAELRAYEADPFQVDALIKQGYISSAADLKDFYLDPKVGKEQLELNRQTGVFTAEALRRAKSGIITDASQLANFKQLTASLAAKGYSEAQISQLAGTGFENIAQEIIPTTKFAQIYDKAGGTVESNAALTEGIQKELLSEEFQGTASEKRKRLAELETRAFQGSSGRASGRSASYNTYSTAGLI